MNILHLIGYLGKAQGGPVESLRLLASAQSELGNNVRVLHTGRPSDGDLSIFPGDVDVHNVKSFGLMRWAPKLISSSCANGFTPDVVHSHGLWFDVSRKAEKLSRKVGVPHIVSPCGMLQRQALHISWWKKRPIWMAFQKRVLLSADIIHAKSKAEASGILRVLPKARVKTIPNAIETPPKEAAMDAGKDINSFKEMLFQRSGILPSHRVVLFIGRVHPVKGLERLLEAWQGIHEKFKEWRLVIVGPAENGYRTKLEAMIKVQAKSKKGAGAEPFDAQCGVLFIDGIYGEKRWEAYARADVFIAPSDFENFGQSIAEALSVGVPVITTHGTPWEKLRERKCGWWVDPSPRSIASALEEAMGLSDAEREARGQISMRLVSRYFPSKVAEEMCLLYKSLMANRSQN